MYIAVNDYLAVGATTGVGIATRRGRVAAVAVVVCHVQLQGGGTKLRGPKCLNNSFILKIPTSHDLFTFTFKFYLLTRNSWINVQQVRR